MYSLLSYKKLVKYTVVVVVVLFLFLFLIDESGQIEISREDMGYLNSVLSAASQVHADDSPVTGGGQRLFFLLLTFFF